mmetsp:Transcript_46190/g.136432  ORF Transcript_46190/g.136432 Transcript_46190/m.136432 type:complete len:101 (+) Transcript_46190:1302-1604(+)
MRLAMLELRWELLLLERGFHLPVEQGTTLQLQLLLQVVELASTLFKCSFLGQGRTFIVCCVLVDGVGGGDFTRLRQCGFHLANFASENGNSARRSLEPRF